MPNPHQQQDQVVKLISECFVKPKHEVEAAKEPHYLGPIDLGMLYGHAIQKGLLFSLDKSSPSTLSNLLDNLNSALSVALVHFCPLAGLLATQKFEDEQACAIFVDCNKGLGARIVHAAAPNVAKSDILSPTAEATVVQCLFDLGEKFTNYDCHTRPLLSIQVTELVDGIFIGFTMSHSVGDGTSFLHFISMLSEIFCSNSDNTCARHISNVPVFTYRPWVDVPHEHVDGPIIKMPYSGNEEALKWPDPGPLRERIFHFSSASLAMLKAEASQECVTHKISSFQALSALVWRSITKARALPPDQETACCMLINARPRLEPPISDNYFGNYISHARVICKVNEVLEHNLGWTAMRIQESVMAQDSKTINSVWKWAIDIITSMSEREAEGDPRDRHHGPNRVVIGGSARFDMYGPEFGLGKAVAVRMGYGNKEDGKVTANPGWEGDGSVDLEITLRPKSMASLETDNEFMSFVSSS